MWIHKIKLAESLDSKDFNLLGRKVVSIFLEHTHQCLLCFGFFYNSNPKYDYGMLKGRSGGAMVLGKFPRPGRPTNLDYSRAKAYCACSRCGWVLFGHFFLSSIISLLSPSLWETARYKLIYCVKGPLSPKQPTNLNVNGLS